VLPEHPSFVHQAKKSTGLRNDKYTQTLPIRGLTWVSSWFIASFSSPSRPTNSGAELQFRAKYKLD